MKFEAAAMTPGRAKRYQKGTEPSAKSTHAVAAPPLRQAARVRGSRLLCCSGKERERRNPGDEKPSSRRGW